MTGRLADLDLAFIDEIIAHTSMRVQARDDDNG